MNSGKEPQDSHQMVIQPQSNEQMLKEKDPLFSGQMKLRNEQTEHPFSPGQTKNQEGIQLIMNENYSKNKENQFCEHSMPLEELRNRLKAEAEAGASGNKKTDQTKGNNKGSTYLLNNLSSSIKQQSLLFKSFLLSYNLAILFALVIFIIAYVYYLEKSHLVLYFLLLWIFFTFRNFGESSFSERESYNIIPVGSTVIRNGKQQLCMTSSIVAGEIIVLEKNMRVPADCRIVQMEQTLMIDYTQFFKEFSPRAMTINCTDPNQYQLSRNIALQGTLVVEGHGTAIALRNAQESYLSTIISTVRSQDSQVKPPLKEELRIFANYSSLVAMAFTVLFILITVFAFEYSVLESFFFGGCVLISMAPQGLVAIAHYAKMVAQKKNSFTFTSLEKPIEQLANVSCICADLSTVVDSGKIELSSFWINRSTLPASKNDPMDKTTMKMRIGSLVTSDSPSEYNSAKRTISAIGNGNPIDDALIKFYRHNQNVQSSDVLPKLALNENGSPARILFDPNLHFSLAIVEEKTFNGNYVLYVKGTPQVIWGACSTVEVNGFTSVINQSIHDEFDIAVKSFANKGETVLAYAKLELNSNDFPLSAQNKFFSSSGKLLVDLNNLTLLGLASFSNPIAPKAKQAIQSCRVAGLKVLFVSQNDPLTVAAIAKQIGLISGTDSLAIDTIENKIQLDPIAWDKQVEKASAIIVNGHRINSIISSQNKEGETKFTQWLSKPVCLFAQSDGDAKIKILTLLRSSGQSTAVVVNNVDEISLATVSISPSGASPVMRFIQHVSLNPQLDQCDFQSIIDSISVSRTYEDNLKKIFIYIGTQQMAQILPIFALIVLRIPLAISAIFMILLSCLLSILPALSLAREEPEIDIMIQGEDTPFNTKVKTSSQRIVTFKSVIFSYLVFGMIAAGAGFSAFLTTFNHFGFHYKDVLGLATIKGYFPNAHSSLTLGYDQDVFDDYMQSIENHFELSAHTALNYTLPHWNSLFMTPDGDCTKDIEAHHPNFEYINWNEHGTQKVDLRKVLVYCDEKDSLWKTAITWSYCDPSDYFNYSSPIDNSACYTVDALNFSQTSYLIAIVFFQILHIFILKSLRRSFVFTSFNGYMVASVLLQIAISVFLVEVPGIQTLVRSRPLEFWQWGQSAAPFTGLVIFHHELRKFLASRILWIKKFISL